MACLLDRDGAIERVFRGALVRIAPKHDYRCRNVVTRGGVVVALGRIAGEIDYLNFRDPVHDRKPHAASMNVWPDMGRYRRADLTTRSDLGEFRHLSWSNKNGHVDRAFFIPDQEEVDP